MSIPRPSPLIVTEISYGLGNQMFQYAIGRRLAHAANGRLILLFKQEYKTNYARSFGLKHFNISGGGVRDERVDPGAAAAPRMRARLADRIAWFARRFRKIPIIRERTVHDLAPGTHATLFMPELLDWRGGVHLMGYWQNERYFADIGDIIRKDFTLKTALDERSQAALARIQAGPSAFIHIRRGDYLKPEHIALYGVRGKDYYDTAVALLRQQAGPDLRFFVFSDDPAWAKEHSIGGDSAEIIDWNGPTPERDLALMTACRHAIIANSSFSWWGAWLGEKAGQIVIAPRHWYKSIPLYQDILPERWLRL